MNPAGPRKPGPQARRAFRTAQPGSPESGSPDLAGTPAISFDQDDQGDDREEIDDPDDGPGGAPGDLEQISQGPRGEGGPGFGAGPGMPFGAVREWGGFGPRFSPMMQRPGEALQAVLGLDDGQVQKLRQLQREKADKLIEARRELEQKQLSLLDQLEQEEPDGAALVSTVKSIHALRKQAGEIEKEFQARTAAVLNDEQRAKVKAIQETRQIRSALDEAARFDLVQRAENGPGGRMRNGFDGPVRTGPEGPIYDGPKGPGPDGPGAPVPQQ
jgi:Spy/CpxP family protein refolding chaperone